MVSADAIGMHDVRAIVLQESRYRSIAHEDIQTFCRSFRRRVDRCRLCRAASRAVVRAFAFQRHARPVVQSRKGHRGSANDFYGVPMNRPHVPAFREDEFVVMNARLDAIVLDQDAWEDATDQSGIDREMLGLSPWRPSILDWTE